MDIKKGGFNELKHIRVQYLAEMNTQIRYDACHWRGWSDTWLIYEDDHLIGYAAVKGKDALADRDALFEFFLLPEFRRQAYRICRDLIEISEIGFIECQSNDPFLHSLFYELTTDQSAQAILFEAGKTTSLHIAEAIFRMQRSGDEIWGKSEKDKGLYVLEIDGEIVADGGYLNHYNYPYSDLYMEVSPDHRQQGYGSFIIQEIKKLCYKKGRIPAARCNINNKASKACLTKAGMIVSGYMLIGKIKG